MRTFLTKTLIGITATAAILGCATGGGPDDATQIQNVLKDFEKTFAKQDLEAMFALFSDDFESSWGNRQETMAFLKDAKAQGYMDDAYMNLENAETTISGDLAKVTHLEGGSSAGTSTIELTLQRRNGGWIIVGMDTFY